MFETVVGENMIGYYGFGMKASQMNKARQRIKETYGKKVMCMNDGRVFLSISEAAREYCISTNSVRRSAMKHVGVRPKGRKAVYFFGFYGKDGE